MRRSAWLLGFAASLVVALLVAAAAPSAQRVNRPAARSFQVEEASIGDIQRAIEKKQLTATELVYLYLDRVTAYNGTCVNQPEGILGRFSPIRNAGQINALMTLNLRPQTRKALGFDDRKARSMTDLVDNDPAMPDALEVAAELDRKFAQTGKLVGPLHGVVMAIKDQYNTFDMRTTSGGDAPYANDRPPRDAAVVKRLRDAGAIILAKSNMGEYGAGDRSSFGGVYCNPYDTERGIGGSSGGSASSVATNMVTCSIAEETSPSIRMPARFASIVGLAPSQGLVSRDGMFGGGISDRVGPMCRTVADTARVMDVIAGYDPADELTVFGIGRKPAESYQSVASKNVKSLAGVRIGVIREYMNTDLFTEADVETIEIVDRAVQDLRSLGATIIDPGPKGALFQDCIDKYVPHARNAFLVKQFPSLFPADSSGNPTADHIPLLLDMRSKLSTVPDRPTIRSFGPGVAVGETKYRLNRYLKERGDQNIQSISDLIDKSSFYTDIRPDARFPDKKANLENANKALTLDMRDRMELRFAVQQVVLQCMTALNLDAVTYPSGNIPPYILGQPSEPSKNAREHQAWTFLGQQGFPAMTVPAGFTTRVFDRVRDSAAPGGTRLVGPVPAKLPVGIDFLARPFDEAVLIRIGAAYEAATKHRVPPPTFGPVRQPSSK